MGEDRFMCNSIKQQNGTEESKILTKKKKINIANGFRNSILQEMEPSNLLSNRTQRILREEMTTHPRPDEVDELERPIEIQI